MAKTDLKAKFDLALKKFVNRYKKNPRVIAILVSGSYIHSKPDKNSDLDVYIVLDKPKFRERGNTWINGVEIEYFINPVKQIRHYFKTEVGTKAPCTAHMFANSIVLYQKDDIVNQIIKEAKKLTKKPMKKMSKMDVEFAKYFIDDFEKDLEDVYLKKDEFAFNQVSFEVLDKALNLFFSIKRVPKEKSKRLFAQMERLDSKFSELYKDSLLEKDMSKKYNKIRKLVRHIEHNLGGKRPKEWKLKSKCTC